MDVDVSTSVAGNKPQRIRRIQTVTLVLLFMAGIVNFLDRSSLSVAGEAIRGELGLSATEFGVLLSAFSLSYGFSQLPSGILLDRFGPRIVLGAGLIFWSLMQALTGMVNSFSHFILMRIGLGIGEAPFMPAGVKSITDWYAQKERGTALGIFNSSTVIGQAIAPPALVLMQLAWGWRAMFVIIDVAGIPFLAAAVGMWVNGIVVDRLAKKGYDLAKTRKTAIVCGLMMSALGTLLVVQSSSPAQAVAFISMALFCVHFAGTSAWGLVQVMVSETKVASIAGIQNFGSFVFASFAPIVTGWVVDTTHSFNLALVIAACVTFTGALCYFFIVKDRIE
ncbi:MFS transporter [Escherichia coli]|uniref:MFS transporter n=1 Tax=Escherichia coli TaxID=562 RepID=UPI002ED40AAF|nr:MFS transporter [Escherichia coli]MEE4436955.1 MFS transporter [Escherichia coli]MEE4474924.1 MFS transporter [Escherichia coli]